MLRSTGHFYRKNQEGSSSDRGLWTWRTPWLASGGGDSAEPSYQPASGQPCLPGRWGLGILFPSGLGQVFPPF